MIFIISFILELVFTSALYENILAQETIEITLLACHITCGSVIAFFIFSKIQVIYFQGMIQYFSSIWNICNFLNSAVYSAYIAVLYTYTADYQSTMIKGLQCGIIILSFIKINYYLRIFEGISFLVQMLPSVLNDLRFFLMYFLLFICTFALFLLTLIEGNDNGEN